MKDLRKELDELVDAIMVRLPGESPVEQGVRIANEAADAVGTFVAQFDGVNVDQDYAQARIVVSQWASELAMKLDIPWNLDVVVPMLAGLAVDKLKEYNGRVDQLKGLYLRPLFASFKEFGDRGLAAIQS